MQKKVREYIKKNHLLSMGDGIVVAFSGGPDSLYLLNVLLELKEEWQLQLAAVHINHLLMKEAKEHVAFVRSYCEQHGVPLYYFEKDIGAYAKERKMSVEEAGRAFRYEKFYEVKRQLGYQSIAVAHHKNDKAETVLYRMARGTGWKGMAAIRPKQEELIRPLLCITKEEILTALKDQRYNVDPSNEETVYARNQIRHKVLPELCKVNEQAMEHIAELSEHMEELGAYLEGEIEKACKSCFHIRENGLDLDRKALLLLPVFLQKEVLKAALEQVAGRQKDLTRVHVESLMQLLYAQSGRSLAFPYGMTASRQYDVITLRKEQTEEACEAVLLTGEGTYFIDFANGFIKMEIFSTNGEEFSRKMYTKTFDYDKIKNHIMIRKWEKEDFFVMNDAGQKKKLNRYFIDRKIPAEQRKQIPLVADGSHILWVIGERISEAYKITEHTKTILRLTWLPMEEE